MVSLAVLEGALSENMRKSYGFPEPPPKGALSENFKKSYDFPAVPPAGPQRKREESIFF